MTNAAGNARHDEVRSRAFEDLKRFEVVMDGHFDYGNGFHGKLYLNPHQLFQLVASCHQLFKRFMHSAHRLAPALRGERRHPDR